SIDGQGAVRIAAGIGWQVLARDRQSAPPGRGNCPQPFQEGANKARNPQSHTDRGRSNPPPPDYLLKCKVSPERYSTRTSLRITLGGPANNDRWCLFERRK